MPPTTCSICTACASASTRCSSAERRRELAAACFGFLPHRAELDLAGWADADIFAY